MRSSEVAGLDYALMLLADARLPAGGHTMSGGLEPALLAGLDPAAVPDYLAARLASTVRVDAATAVLARHDCLTGADATAVADAWAARTPSHVLRDAGYVAGRGLCRLLGHLAAHPERGHASAGASAHASAHASARASAWVAPLVEARTSWRPVVLGALAAALGLDAGRTALLLAYDDVQTVTAAALKLLPLDPLVALDWSLDARAAVADLVADLADLTHLCEIPADSAPALEAWHHAHARTERRLFRA